MNGGQKQTQLAASPNNLCVPNPYRKIPTSSSISPTSVTHSAPRSPNPFDKRSRNHRVGVRRRAVFKNGDCNVHQSQLLQRRYRFFNDLFTTLVDCQWRWTLLAFFLSFIFTWLFYAIIYWLSAWAHGDLELLHMPDMQEANGWQPCIVNIYSFTSAFIFSLETQHTIGYGVRSITEECPEAIFILCLQSSTGVLMQALMVGVVFAKITRSKNRSQTLLFSRHCVISRRNGELCLMFRIGDMRKSHIIGASVRAQLISKQTTDEGELLATHQTELSLETEAGGGSNLFFIWPTIVVHRIGRTSPLYECSAADLIYGPAFEIVVVLEGTIESTGQTTQARSSYLNTEILWGHRFEPVVEYSKDTRGYEIAFSKFDSTLLVSISTCSAKELEEEEDKEGVQSGGNFFDFSTNSLLKHKHLLPQDHVIAIEEDDEFVMNYYALSRHSLPQKMNAQLVRTQDLDTESAHTQG